MFIRFWLNRFWNAFVNKINNACYIPYSGLMPHIFPFNLQFNKLVFIQENAFQNVLKCRSIRQGLNVWMYSAAEYLCVGSFM